MSKQFGRHHQDNYKPSDVLWGKQTRLSLRFNIGKLPANVNFKLVIGASLIAGIGFTMSTFIAALGFDEQATQLHNAKTSILFASLLAAILGVLFIRFVAAKRMSR